MSTPVTNYSSQIDSMSKDFSTILTTFKEKFVDYYSNLNSTSSQNNYDAAKNNLNDEISKMYNLKSSIMTSISIANNNNGDLEKKIGLDEDNIKMMTDQYEQQTGNSSETLISDAKEKYKIQYVANISMFFGIAAMIWIFSSFMKNSSSSVSSSSMPKFRR